MEFEEHAQESASVPSEVIDEVAAEMEAVSISDGATKRYLTTETGRVQYSCSLNFDDSMFFFTFCLY